MKGQYTLTAALVIVSAFVLGLFVADNQHKGDWNDGWQDGYSASEAAVTHLDARLAASGLCSYAKLACGGRK